MYFANLKVGAEMNKSKNSLTKFFLEALGFKKILSFPSFLLWDMEKFRERSGGKT